MSTLDLPSLPLPSAAPTPRQPTPERFFQGIAFLYSLMALTLVSRHTPIVLSTPTNFWVNPLLTLATALVCGATFLRAMGTHELPVGTLLRCLGVVFVLGVVMDTYQVLTQFANDGGNPPLLAPLSIQRLDYNTLTIGGALFMIFELTSMVFGEELLKLGPVIWLIRSGKINNAQSAMSCAALAGLVFGLIESNIYGYVFLPADGQPWPNYLQRYIAMPITHALWDAMGAAIIFMLSRRSGGADRLSRPSRKICIFAYLIVSIVHLCHNSLQTISPPIMQMMTMVWMMMVFVLGKLAWRNRTSPAEPAKVRPITITIALLLTTASVVAMFIPWGSLREARKIAELQQVVELTDRVLQGDPTRSIKLQPQDLDIYAQQLQYNHSPLPWVRDDILEAIEGAQAVRPGDQIVPLSMEVARFSPSEFRLSVTLRRPYLLLNNCRHELNGLSRAQELEPWFGLTGRWDIEVLEARLSPAFGQPPKGVDKFAVLLLSGSRLEDPLLPADQSESIDITGPLAKPWKTSISLQSVSPVIGLAYINGSRDTQILDAAILDWRSFSGQISMARGSTIKLKVDYDGQ